MNDLAATNDTAAFVQPTRLYAKSDVRTRGQKTIYANFLKRLFDVTLVCVTAPPVLMILLIATVAVALDGGRPFYSQLRIGRNGTHFRMWKLRSMVVDADAALQKHLDGNADDAQEWAVYQKLKDDPRITRVGRILRKTSIDELPQLWNVLTGTMSLVGPRPMMVDQATLYPGTCYYALRPGITGNWQVSDRNKTAFEDRAEFDTQYRRELSFTSDIGILLKTVPAVLRSTGY